MRRWTAVAIVAMALGCRKGSTPIPDIDIEVPPAASAKVEGPNAFDRYTQLAAEAKERATVSLDARDTDGNRSKVLREMEPVLADLAHAIQLPCGFRYSLSEPFDPKPHQIGWLQIGRAIVWRIEKAVEEREFDAGAQWTVVAVTFGADLSGGDVSDSSLGLGIIDGARGAIAPYLTELSDEGLASFAGGVARALQRIPDPVATIQNETVRGTAAIKTLQKAIIDGKEGEFATWLYKDSRETAEKLAKAGQLERNAFFQALVDEQVRLSAAVSAAAMTAAANRGQIKVSLKGGEKSIADQFLTAAVPWLSVRDYTIARTRLLYCTAVLIGSARKSGAAPANLDALEPILRTDPYTGIEFGYLPMGKEFLVYSYGIDGKDDRGDTNADRTEPDLLVEGFQR